VDDPIGSTWGYTKDMHISSPANVIAKLVDTVSKNGNLLLNLSPTAEGAIPEAQQQTLLAIGQWLQINGEAIYGTHPWSQFAEGAGKNGYRFTVKGQTLYAIALFWPGNEALITSLSKDKPACQVQSVQLLGQKEPLKFRQDSSGLRIVLPTEKPCDHAYAFRITGLRLE
jgi:alpha-L-fucosidase